MRKDINAVVQAVISDRLEWLEDVLAGLLINGVAKGEIEVQHHPDRLVVAVQGKPLYSHRITVGQVEI